MLKSKLFNKYISKNSFHKFAHPHTQVKKKYYQKFKYKRLDLKKGEAILFDVNLIHGGTENLGSKSRVNLEFRLYNNKEINITK